MNLQNHKALVARALERAPVYENSILRKILKSEGYSRADIQLHFEGKGFRDQLKAIRTAGSSDRPAARRRSVAEASA
jgi:hypothetical protein